MARAGLWVMGLSHTAPAQSLGPEREGCSLCRLGPHPEERPQGYPLVQVPVLHSHRYDEAAQEQHVCVLHVLDTHLWGNTGLVRAALGPQSPRRVRQPDANPTPNLVPTPGATWSGEGRSRGLCPCRMDGFPHGPGSSERGLEGAPWRGCRKTPGAAHLLGVQNLQEREQEGGHEGSDCQRDDLGAPVDGHEDDDVGTPDKLRRRP